MLDHKKISEKTAQLQTLETELIALLDKVLAKTAQMKGVEADLWSLLDKGLPPHVEAPIRGAIGSMRQTTINLEALLERAKTVQSEP